MDEVALSAWLRTAPSPAAEDEGEADRLNRAREGEGSAFSLSANGPPDQSGDWLASEESKLIG